MAEKRSAALLLAVLEIVDRLNEETPQRQSNGAGGIVRWPTVVTTLDYLQPGAGWTDSTVRKTFKDYKHKTHEARGAMIASVQVPNLRELVTEIRERGTRPAGKAPVIPGEREPQPTQKKGKPTAQERLEGIRRAEQDIMDRAEELAAEEIELEQERSRRRIAERMAEQYKKRAAFVVSAMEMLKDIVVPMDPARWAPGAVPAVHIKKEIDSTLILADIHVGDEIHSDTMGALNEYNFPIFQQKAKRLVGGIRESLEVLREYGPCKRVNILGLGDWTTGTKIFPGQAHHIEFGAMEQAIRGADEMANVYMEILEMPGVEQVVARHVPGNHGRPGRKGEDPFEDNWDLVLYEFMRLRLQNQPRMDFQWYKSWWMKPVIRGWEFLCAHGDEVKGWAGIPTYGLRRWAARWREMLDSIGQRYDYGVIGHHHVEVEEPNLIISGAWPGASFFSAKELQMGGPATQMFYAVSAERGIEWRRRLPLDPPKRSVTQEAV